MKSKIDTSAKTVAENICVWYDGTLRPARGHHGDCHWFFDGQVWYHLG